MEQSGEVALSEIREINGRKYEIDAELLLSSSQFGWLSSVQTDIKKDLHQARQNLATAENSVFLAQQAMEKHQEFATHRLNRVRDELLKEHKLVMLPGQELIMAPSKSGEPMACIVKEASMVMTNVNGGVHAAPAC